MASTEKVYSEVLSEIIGKLINTAYENGISVMVISVIENEEGMAEIAMDVGITGGENDPIRLIQQAIVEVLTKFGNKEETK